MFCDAGRDVGNERAGRSRQLVCLRLLAVGGSAMVEECLRWTLGPCNGPYLSFVEREEIALPRVQGVGEIGAGQVGRSPSTESRELRSQRGQTRAASSSIGIGRAVEGRSCRTATQALQARDNLACVTTCKTVPDRERSGPDDRGRRARRARHWIGRNKPHRVDRRSWVRGWSPEQISVTGFGSISPMMSPCGSVRHAIYQALTSRAEARCKA